MCQVLGTNEGDAERLGAEGGGRRHYLDEQLQLGKRTGQLLEQSSAASILHERRASCLTGRNFGGITRELDGCDTWEGAGDKLPVGINKKIPMKTNPTLVIFTPEAINGNIFPEISSISTEAYPTRSSQIWSVLGYDDDPRELYEIPEIRRYFTELHRRYPGWLTLLDFELNPWRSAIFLMCCLPTPPNKSTSHTSASIAMFNGPEFEELLRCHRSG